MCIDRRPLVARHRGEVSSQATGIAGTTVALAQTVQEDIAIAVANDRVAEVKRFLAGGADPSMVDRNGDPLLVIAVREGSAAAFDVLLAARADVNGRTKFGDTPLMVAGTRAAGSHS
jgi:ankyrin repeat protein